MQLKKYQQKVLDSLRDYILEIGKYEPEKAAGVAFMIKSDKQYNWAPELGSNPFICIKVPTGGGKTLIATHSIDIVFEKYLGERNGKGLVMWFVPSDAIRTQTLNNLKNRKHHYRSLLDQKFNNAIQVFDLSEAKAIKRDDLENNLCVVVSTLSAFRRNNKEWLKVYQDNGSLMGHFEGLDNKDFGFLDKDKDGEIKYSLSNVIRLHNPLIIVDEGHNIQTELSFDMLKGLNPCFVLEFTATPKGQSNVLINISAKELKEEKMIKMPIYLENKTPWQETIHAGITKLNDLDKKAKKVKDEYIRPIMLLQAEQEKENTQKIYVDKIHKFLTEETKVPAEQIAIKTSKTDTLPSLEELSKRKCPIRYIITVNALREGWDCPFAYVLVSVSNLGARLSVEQTIGRIMRLPNAQEKADQDLNSAYIFATTRNFNQASEMVIKGLKDNGYEDIIPVSGGVSVQAEEFKKVIPDEKIELPFINIKDGNTLRKLDYVSDLIGDDSILKNQSAEIDFHVVDYNMVEKIDIGHEGKLLRDSAGKLNLIYHYDDFSKDDLLNWLRIKVQRGFISIDEMSSYLERAVDFLLKENKLSKLSAHRYQVKEAIDKKIDEITDKVTRNKFDELVSKKLIKASGEGFVFSNEITLLNVFPNKFSKHLYERASKMNKEESDFAYQLDGLDNLAWWFRNPEFSGFSIQGWFKNKFYPDFIVKTKKGNYFVLEYKGSHLKGAEDTQYKEAIGKKWAELAGDKYQFELVDKNNLDEVVERISRS